jgi:hypothetical protein
MKSLCYLFATLAACLAAGAQSVLTDVVYPATSAYMADYANMLTFNGATNATSITNRVDGNLYHTFHVYNTGTNAIQYVIDKSLDGTNFVAGATNAVAASSNSESSIVGKEAFFRVRTFATNTTGSIFYLGGR